MGKGLDIQPEGTHVAFTAGTGILVFIDLVAHLIRKILGLLTEDENHQLTQKFRFVLYAAFPKEEDGICLDMCYGLHDLCMKYKLGAFLFITRFSN